MSYQVSLPDIPVYDFSDTFTFNFETRKFLLCFTKKVLGFILFIFGFFYKIPQFYLTVPD